MGSARLAILTVTLAASAALLPQRAQALWWNHTPIDYEECAEAAEKSATKEIRASALSECSVKFAGRRKSGGGYTYFDFMQNRNFDIAGPNPTPAEQKHIDEQYIVYLDGQRRSNIASALSAAREQSLPQPASLQSAPIKPPAPAVIAKQTAPVDGRLRAKTNNCTKQSFSCNWPRISEGLNDLKKLFGVSPNKARRGYPDIVNREVVSR